MISVRRAVDATPRARALLVFKDSNTDNHTVSLYGPTVHQLDEKYISYKPGLKVEGKIFYVYNTETNEYEDVVAKEGAEIFNSYENNTATGGWSHAEGFETIVSGSYSHAEGRYTTASGYFGSHAEGESTKAIGSSSHAEGRYTTASGNYSHAEGDNTEAAGLASHAEGNATETSGEYAHVEGNWTIASGRYQHVQGKYNIEDTESKYAHIVGNGTSNTKRSNAHTVDWDGNGEFKGDVIANGCGGENPISLIALHEKVNDCEPFIITVTVSADPSITECTMDKTFAEIEAAYKNGKKLYVVDTSMYRYHNLCDYSEGNSISFYSCNFSGGLYWIQSFRIDSDNTITRNYDTISLGTDKLETSAFTVTGAINEMNTNIRALQKIVTPTAIILSSPNGTSFNVTIGDDGALTATEIV